MLRSEPSAKIGVEWMETTRWNNVAIIGYVLINLEMISMEESGDRIPFLLHVTV